MPPAGSRGGRAIGGRPALTLHQLEIFATIATERGFARAADALPLSGAAVTEQMKLLERAVGERLIIRSRGRQGLELTRAGQLLLETCGEVFSSLEAGLRRIETARERREMCIAVGVGEHFRGYPLPALYAAFRRSRPDVEVRSIVIPARHRLEEVRGGQLDFALVLGPVAGNDLEVMSLASFDLVFVGPLDHALQREETEAGLEALAGESLIAGDASSFIRSLLTERATAVGTALHPSWEISSEDGQLDAVACGLGIALVPYHSVAVRLARKEVVLLRVRGFPLRLDWLLVSAAQGLSSAGKAFRQYLLNQRGQIEAQTLAPSGYPAL